jgi:hypothetical protein
MRSKSIHHLSFGLVELCEQSDAPGMEGGALFGDREAACGAVEQPDTQPRLQLTDAPGDGCLGQTQPPMSF